METSSLKVVKSLSPETAQPNFTAFISNLKQQEMEWYATFRSHVTDKIEWYDVDELIEQGTRTLLPLNTLAAMTIMKTGFGWSNAQLVNECKNNLRVRHALRINDLSEIPPVSMVAQFQTLVNTFEKQTGIDLMASLIEKITEENGPVMKLGGGRIMLWAMRVA